MSWAMTLTLWDVVAVAGVSWLMQYAAYALFSLIEDDGGDDDADGR